MKKRARSILQWSGLLALFLFLIFCPKAAANSIRNSLLLCAETVIPALFPYLVLSNFLSQSAFAEIKWLNRLFCIHGNGTPALLLGALGGYPTGAAAIRSLYLGGQISKDDANRLLFFSCNAGPAFILGMVGGGLYHSTSVGLALFGIQLLSSLLCGFLLPRDSGNNPSTNETHAAQTPLPTAITRSIAEAGLTMLKICSFICAFSLILEVESMIFGDGVAFLILGSITELTAGVTNIAAADLNWTLKFILTASAISFGGVCVLLQTISVLDGSGLDAKRYLCGKGVQAGICAVLAWPVSYFLSPRLSVGGFPVNFVPLSPWPWTLCSIFLVFLIFRKFTTSNSPASGL